VDFLSAPSNFLVQWSLNFDSKDLGLQDLDLWFRCMADSCNCQSTAFHVWPGLLPMFCKRVQQCLLICESARSRTRMHVSTPWAAYVPNRSIQSCCTALASAGINVLCRRWPRQALTQIGPSSISFFEHWVRGCLSTLMIMMIIIMIIKWSWLAEPRSPAPRSPGALGAQRPPPRGRARGGGHQRNEHNVRRGRGRGLMAEAAWELGTS
jgi:hypothetical protein